MNKKIKILEDILYDYESRFDIEVIKYLLDSIPDSELEKITEATHLGIGSNFKIETSFYGKALLFLNRIDIDSEISKQWINVLCNKNPNLYETIFNFTSLNIKKENSPILEANFDTVRAVQNLLDFSTRPKEFKDVSEAVLTIELLNEKQSGLTPITKFLKDNNKVLLDIVFKNRENISKKFLSKKSSFIDLTLKSSLIRPILYMRSDTKFTDYISADDLGPIAIFSLSKNYSQVSKYLFKLVMESFPAQDWVKSYKDSRLNLLKKNDKTYPILPMFKEAFFNTYGININEYTCSEAGKRYNENSYAYSLSKGENFVSILDYMLSGLKNENVNLEHVGHIYNSAFKLNDLTLVNTLNKYFPFEDLITRIEDPVLKNAINTKVSEDSFRIHVIRSKEVGEDKKFKSWKEWRADNFKNILDSSLSESASQNKRLKI